MKINRQGHWCQLLLVAAILFEHANAEKQKRQIFREQVLPALGGKIPEEAFRTDRLALNRLNKEGITVPDGIVLDARHVHKHSYSDQKMFEIIKVYLTSDGRYISPEGRPHYNHPKTVDTTYIIRRPIMYTNHKTLNTHEKLESYRKPQAYSNQRQFVPISLSVKPDIYKSIVMPLIFPTDTELFDSSWRTEYDWDTDVYEPFNDYFIDDIALFNSHQVITNYQGFLDEFHKRSLRHVNFESSDKNQQHHQNQKYQDLQTGLKLSSYEKIKSNIVNSHNSAYTNLTSIPETNFSCNGRTGMFADIETKCQVFHICLDSSKVSSLCPSGTAFCEANKRCEWFDIVQCKQ